MKKILFIIMIIIVALVVIMCLRLLGLQPVATINKYAGDALSTLQTPLSTVSDPERPIETAESTSISTSEPVPLKLVAPLDRAAERITKKSFGTYVTPQNSPVSPERFSGYHSGVDFEILSGEDSLDVPVYAICTGPLLTKQWVSGYGGVVVQQCDIEQQTVTVLYGHMRLASVTAAPDQTVQVNESLGVLGTGYSGETDGERKHLHMSIHRGNAITWAGYVSSKAALTDWMDPKTVLGL